MKIWIALLLVAPSTFAAIKIPVARLEAGPCGAAPRTSSAMLLRADGKTFAVASSDGVFLSRDSARFCHTLALPGEKPTPAILRVADWGNGLALLEWTGRVPLADWPTHADLAKPWNIYAGESYTLRSFAGETTGGVALSDRSDRHLFAQATEVTEVQGAAVPGDYVGGVAIYGDEEFRGIISHQFLLLQPGIPTRPQPWTWKSNEKRSYLLVLGRHMVPNWLGVYLAPGAPVPALQKYVEDQKPTVGTETVVGGGLAYRALCPALGSKPTSGEFPIGGSNGVGSGGGIPGVHACLIRATLRADAASPFPFAEQQKWHELAVKRLTGGLELELPFVFNRDEDSGDLTHDSFYSLGEMFQLWLRPEMRLATIWPQPGDDRPIRALGRAAAKAASQQYGDIGLSDERLRQAIRQSYLLGRLEDSDHAKEVTAADLDRLLDPNGIFAFAWSYLAHPLPFTVNYHVREKVEALRAQVGGT